MLNIMQSRLNIYCFYDDCIVFMVLSLDSWCKGKNTLLQ